MSNRIGSTCLFSKQRPIVIPRPISIILARNIIFVNLLHQGDTVLIYPRAINFCQKCKVFYNRIYSLLYKLLCYNKVRGGAGYLFYKEVFIMAKWDPEDSSTHWDIERQLRAMLDGKRVRYYNGVFEGSVEDVYIHSDGSAEVNMYGSDNNDSTGHYHFNLMLHSDGSFTIQNCHRR